MKKQLLLVALAATTLAANAQSSRLKRPSNTANLRVENTAQAPVSNETAVSTARLQSTPKRHTTGGLGTQRINTVSIIQLGTSINLFGAGIGSQTQVDYNKDLNAVIFGRRGNQNVAGSTGNRVTFDLSTDGGMTWDTTFKPLTPATGVTTRYPQFGIMNAPGNTNIANAFMAGVAPNLSPATPNFGTATGWGTDYIYGGTMPNPAIIIGANRSNSDTSLYISPNSIVSGGKFWYTNIKRRFNGTAALLDYRYHNFGSFSLTSASNNAGAIAANTTVFTTDMTGLVDSSIFAPNVAFSPDGQTGYLMAVMTETGSALPGSHPVLWKSTDAGATWTRMPMFNWSTADDNVQAANPGLAIDSVCLQVRYDYNGSKPVIPFITDFDMVVDNVGDLHVGAKINSRFSAAPDSTGFSYRGRSASVITHMRYTDHWELNYLQRNPNDYYDIGGTTSPIRNDEHLQMSRTTDGSKIFIAYTASDTTGRGVDSYPNDTPNVIAYGYDVATNKSTNLLDLTAGTDAELLALIMRLSPTCISNAGTYELPITYAEPNAAGTTNFAKFYYVKGLTISDADFNQSTFLATTGEVASLNSKVVVFPNPTSGVVRVDLNNFTSESTITVTNILGETVASLSKQTGVVSIDLSAQASGMFTVVVTNAEGQGVKKVILTK